MNKFLQMLAIQRWDDHRYYHHNRINQTLHFVSACGFVLAYALLLVDPAVSALIGWLWCMGTRQSGHFFFEPLGYDHVNQATQEHKEAIKVGYNLRRKVILIAIWVALPALLWVQPELFSSVIPAQTASSLIPADMVWLHQVGWAWLMLGAAGLLFRTVHLFFIYDVMTGLVWCTKILTDPFNDIKTYHKAPLALLRGELIDPHHASPEHAPVGAM